MEKQRVIEIMNELLSFLKLNAKQFAESLGFDRAQVVYDIMNPQKKVGISKSMAEKICAKYSNIHKAYLLTGEGKLSSPLEENEKEAKNSQEENQSITEEEEAVKENSNNDPIISFTTGVPYYNVDFIGGFDIVMNDQTINPEYLINFKKYNDAMCWCNVTGHSMEPEINNGDMIALKEVKGWKDYLPFGEVYGIVTDEHRTIKRVTASSKGENFLRLIPTNKSEEYQPQDIPTRLILAIYKVLGCNKRL